MRFFSTIAAAFMASAPIASAGDVLVVAQGTVLSLDGSTSTAPALGGLQIGDSVQTELCFFVPGTPRATSGIDYVTDSGASRLVLPSGTIDGDDALEGRMYLLDGTSVELLSSRIDFPGGIDVITTAVDFDELLFPTDDLALLPGVTTPIPSSVTTQLFALRQGDVTVEVSLDVISFELPGGLGANYCTAAPNSTGAPGQIAGFGSDVAADNDLTLVASQLPPNQFGIFITSRTQAFVPGTNGTSNGNLCLGGTIGRFVGPGLILSTGASGSFSLDVDLTALPQGSGTVAAMAGDVWNFQAWHREGTGLGSNLTDGLEIVLQ